MGDGDIIACVSSGRALCGTFVGKSSEEIGSRRAFKQLLRPPEGNEFMAPDQAYKNASLIYSNIQAGESYCEAVKNSGWSAAVKLSRGSLSPFFFGVGKASVGDLRTDKGKEKKTRSGQKTSEAYHMEYLYVPKKSFSIPRQQMRLSEEALADLRTVRTLKDAEFFLGQYNSHVSTGRYHVGGVLMRSVKMVSKSKTTVQSFLDKFYRNSNSGAEVSYVTVKGGMNYVSMASKAKATAKAAYTAIGPQTDDEEKFMAGLEDKSTWAIIDTSDGAELIPVWEIASVETSVPHESCALLRRAWQRSIEILAAPAITGRLNELLDQSYLKPFPMHALGDSSTQSVASAPARCEEFEASAPPWCEEASPPVECEEASPPVEYEEASPPLECEEDILPENRISSKGKVYTYASDFLVDRPVSEDPYIRLMDRVRHRLEPFVVPVRENSNVGVDDDEDDVFGSMDDVFGSNDLINGNGTAKFSSFEILVQLLIRSDVLVQIALFQLLLEERFAIPCVIPVKEELNDFRHLGEALNFVQLKVVNQEALSIAGNTSLPRVVFVSNRQLVSQRETVDVACKVMNCQFPSKHFKSGIGVGPTVLELGIGFLKTPTMQLLKDMPCLVFCVSGDHNKLGVILENVADIVIIESDPDINPVCPSWISKKASKLFWNIDSVAPGSDRASPKIWGNLDSIIERITKFVRRMISSERNHAITLAECFNSVAPLSPQTSLLNAGDLAAINFDGVRESLTLQRLYTEEAGYYFQSLKEKWRKTELSPKIQRCKDDRVRESGEIEKLPILQLFLRVLQEENDVKRSLCTFQLQHAIDRELQQTLETASMKVSDAFDKSQNEPTHEGLKESYKLAMREHVGQMLGLEHLWRDLSHIFVANPTHHRHFPKLAARHLLDGFPLEIVDGDATTFHKLWVDTVLLELDEKLSTVLKRKPKVFVLSVVGLQSSGKSTLLNIMFGTKLKTSAGMCTRGVFLQLVKSEWPQFDYVLIMDTMGLRAPEYFGRKDTEAQDNRLATFAVLPADACVVMVANEEDNGLKDILPMVMLAFKGSALAEQNTGQMQTKLFFVYRSINLKEVEKLGKNQRKLQTDLQEASLAVANFKIGGPSIDGVRDPLNNFHIDKDEKHSDVKFFGNFTPGDTPREYGAKVEELLQYIHERVYEAGRSSGRGLVEWKEYLGLVWNSIADADFELSFLNHIEHMNYINLQAKMATSRTVVGRKWQHEFELLTNELQVGRNDDQSLSTLWRKLKSEVRYTVQTERENVSNFLEQRQFQKWKIEETSRWEVDRSDDEKNWKAQLKDCIDGVLDFENVVKRYITQMQVEISDVGRRHHDVDIDSLEREKRMEKDFKRIFERIKQDAERNHPPRAKMVERMIFSEYVNHRVIGKKFKFEDDDADKSFLQSIIWGTVKTVVDSWKNWTSFLGQRRDISEEEMERLISRVHHLLQDVKQYSDHVVDEVIQETQDSTISYSHEVEHRTHTLVKGLLTNELVKIQQHWDLRHNVSKRLETQRDYLWQCFQNHADKVDGTQMLSMALCNLLRAKELEDAFKMDITKSIASNLQSRGEWIYNWQVMRAHLDLYLIKLIRSEKFDKLLKLVEDGREHYKIVVDKFIKEEFVRKQLDTGEWSRFIGTVCEAIRGAAIEVEHSEPGVSKPVAFQRSIIKSLRQISPQLARSVSTNASEEVCSKYSDDIDFRQIRDEVSARLNEFQLDLTSSLTEVIDKVRERLTQSNTDRVRPRCDAMCPRCGLTCLKEANHEGVHDTLHQPLGLAGAHYVESNDLVFYSCSQGTKLEKSMVFYDDGSRVDVPYEKWTERYPKWKFPDESLGTVEVREYIFANFQEQLVEHYKGKYKACPEIPSEFKLHKLEELRHKLEIVVRCSSS